MKRNIFRLSLKRALALICAALLSLMTAGCESADRANEIELNEITCEEGTSQMRMWIDDSEVTVEWEDNEAVAALRELAAQGEVIIKMSMYGGFEQVGAIGSALPRSDTQTTTAAGDIVLYSGNQLVVFYGSNSWAYTRLGRVADKTPEEMRELLGRGDVTIRLALEERAAE